MVEGLLAASRSALGSHRISASSYCHRKAVVSSHSMHTRYYYARKARGRGPRNAKDAVCGIWNCYLRYGKHTPHFTLAEHHKSAIVSGLMSHMEHGRRTAGGKQSEESHTHLHANSHHEARAMQQNAAHEFIPAIHVQAAAAREVQTTAAQCSSTLNNPKARVFPVSVFISENPGPSNAGPLQDGRQVHSGIRQHRGAYTTLPMPAASVFSTVVQLPISFSDTQAGGHMHCYSGAHAAAPVQALPASGIAPSHISFTGVHAGTQSRQMDISLVIGFDPRSQLSYILTYQIGTYATSGFTQTSAAVPMAPATMTFELQGALQQGMRPDQRREESGYFGSAGKRSVALKVAQAADAVPE
jgi:hypothetical protein